MKTIKMHKAIRGKHIVNAYLAGIIDGEGSILITKINNKRSGNIWYRMQVSCAMTDPEAIELLRDTFTPDNKQFIYINGREKGYRPVYQWLTTGKTSMRILNELLPYLTVKKQQARLAIEFQLWRMSLPNTGKPRTEQELSRFDSYYQKLKALKQYLQPQRLSEETPKGEAIV